MAPISSSLKAKRENEQKGKRGIEVKRENFEAICRDICRDIC